MTDDKTGPLGNNPSTKPSNTNNTAGTTSEPNPLKRGVTVGRSPIEKTASVSAIEGLRSKTED